MAGPPKLDTHHGTAGIAAPSTDLTAPAPRFQVRLENFTGPFDLLLGLISKHEMDITDIAIATVTDEFLGYLSALTATGGPWALDEASEFLVLAATLLDLKAARLLPAGAVDSDEDLALLEARDLLFARLLQYKAFKEAAAVLGTQLLGEARRYPRLVGLEAQFAALLPELRWTHTAEQFAAVAARALEPKPAPVTQMALEHLHHPAVDLREQTQLMSELLQQGRPPSGDPSSWQPRQFSFAELTRDAASTAVVIARFLALLELFRQDAISFEQPTPLGVLRVRWGTAPLPGSLAPDATAAERGRA